jgi:hypothetical protein
MSQYAPEPRLKLSKLRDIGWELWDPIGILSLAGSWSDEANKRVAGEYDSYLISAALQLRKGEPADQVVNYLIQIESDHMGLGDNATSRQRAKAVVAAILSDSSIWTWPDEQGRFPQSD